MALGSFGGGLGFGLAFVLEDQFSQTSSQIKGEMGTLDKTAGKTADNVMGKFGAMAGMLGIGFSLGASIQAAAALSDQLVTVADVTGLSAKEIENMRGQLEGMDTRTGLPELLGLATLGSQLGIAGDQLASFTAKADAVGLVLGKELGGSAESAVKKLNQLGQIFKDTKGMTPDETIMRLGSAVDAMGDSAAVNLGNVTMFAQKLGEFGDMGPTAAQALGLGTALDSLGVKTKGMASQFGQVLAVMAKSPESMAQFANQVGLSADAFKALFDADPTEAVLQLAESFKKQGLSSSEMLGRLQELKLPSAEVAKMMALLGDNAGLVREKTILANKAFADGSGVMNEAAKRNQTLGAQLEKIQRNFQILLIRIGEAISQGFGPLLDIVNMVIKVFTLFAASPFGKAVLRYTGLLLGFGTATFVVAKGVKMVAGAFSILKKQAISTLIALAPYALAIAPIILIGLAVWKAVNAFKTFDGTVKKGFGGFFQRLGGIIKGIQEIWSSWDSVNQTFEITGETMGKLNQMGIGQLVVNIGTWVVRIYEFLAGVVAGFSEAFGYVWAIVSWVFTKISEGLSLLGVDIGKNTDDINGFGAAGKILGYIMVAVLGAIAIAAISAAIGMIAAFWPIYLIIGLIIGAVMVLSYAWDFFMALFAGAWDVLVMIFDWAANLITYIWEGIKSAWKGFTNWIWDKATSVPIVGPALKWLFGDSSSDSNDSITAAASSKEGSPEVAKAQEGMAGETTGIMENGVQNKGVGLEAFKSETYMNVQPAETVINLDGNEIGRATTNYQSNELSRQ